MEETLTLKEAIRSGVSYFLAFLGFISVVGVMAGIPGGIALLVTGLNNKDPKIKKHRVIWGIVLITIPPFLIIFTLVAFALVNTILGGPVAPSV